ncbi:hypothetical protein ACFL5V_01280 [Fibrobacterota bacterium]
MKFICFALLLALAGCSSQRRTYTPGPSRLKIERPGRGVHLENDLARLMLAGKRIQAMRLCNDILFSSRSKKDRETANYWRTVLMALEEIDEDNHDKAADVIREGAKWWNSSSKEYHAKLIIDILDSLKEKSSSIRTLNRRIKKLKISQKVRQESMTQDLMEEMKELKRKNRELEKLLQELEKVK